MLVWNEDVEKLPLYFDGHKSKDWKIEEWL